MALLSGDGTLTALPTRINPDGIITVLFRLPSDVVLVPLSVGVSFTDIGHLVPRVQAEISQAALMMIIIGTGGGIFNPTASVTPSAVQLNTCGVEVEHLRR